MRYLVIDRALSLRPPGIIAIANDPHILHPFGKPGTPCVSQLRWWNGFNDQQHTPLGSQSVGERIGIKWWCDRRLLYETYAQRLDFLWSHGFPAFAPVYNLS